VRARHLATLLALAVARPAAAEPHKLLVLQSEGRADAALRAKIDAAIVKLAQSAEPQTSAGELNYSDAATAVGCKPETAACKDEVLGMLAVDEIVITTVTPKPGGTEVSVRRIRKGGATRDATMLLATGAPPDRLDGIAPLFGGRPARPTAPVGPAAGPPVGPAPAPPVGPTPAPPVRPTPTAPVMAAPVGPAAAPPVGPAPAPPARIATERPPGEPPVIPAPTAIKHPPPRSVVTTSTTAQADVQPSPQRHRLEIAGMAGGGGLVVLGLLLWGAASDVQSDIDKAPTATDRDLIDLKDLESRGDSYAGLGNLCVIGGLVIGGIGTYFYLKDRRDVSTSSARLMPTVFDHGAGVVFTIGGMP
jgi:hypothetical protein